MHGRSAPATPGHGWTVTACRHRGVASVGFVELLQTRSRSSASTTPPTLDNAGLPHPARPDALPPPEVRLVEGEGFPQRVPVFGDTALEWLDRSAAALVEFFARIDRGEFVAGRTALPDGTGGSRRGPPAALRTAGREPAQLVGLRRRAPGALRRRPADAALRPGRRRPLHRPAFIRWHDERVCERVARGPASHRLRVASPFDPEAQRPTTVVLPALDDPSAGFRAAWRCWRPSRSPTCCASQSGRRHEAGNGNRQPQRRVLVSASACRRSRCARPCC